MRPFFLSPGSSKLTRLGRRVSNVVQGPVEFGLIPHDHWFQPDWIDEEKATAGRNKMVEDNIIYGGKHVDPVFACMLITVHQEASRALPNRS